MHPRHGFSAQPQMILFHFNTLVSAAAEPLHIISTCLLNLDVKFMVVKFSRFVMNIFFTLALLLSFSVFNTLTLSLPKHCMGHFAQAVAQVSEEWLVVHHSYCFSNFLWEIQVIII